MMSFLHLHLNKMKTYRIALVSSKDHPELFGGEKLLPPVLRHLGHEVDVCIWDAPEVQWQSYDAVVIRCPWDYYEKLPQFLAWLDTLAAGKVRVINDIDTLRWNLNKAYLFELAQAGLPVIPTQLVARSDQRSLQQIFDAIQSKEIVIKPVQSAGAWRTLRINQNNLADAELNFSAWRQEQDFLVQAFMPEIVAAGEWSLIYFDGQFSHALIKRAKDGDFRVQSEHGGTVLKADAPENICAQAFKILHFLPKMPCYARVDGVVRDGAFLLMELELLEPELFLEIEAQAAHRFAMAILSHLNP
jgi:glutathione synthase/RimK-type ligase-like ATP-grasp enzyme